MCDFTVDVAAIAASHGFDPELILRHNPKLDELLDDGLIHMAAGTIRANEQYRFIVRSVAAAFDAYLGKGGRAFSKAA
jgi:oxygen-independent coproporphyrinogen-3 oxidase